MNRDKVFISYSHKDEKWLGKLNTMLKPLVRDEKLSIWDDTKVRVGAEWREVIKNALASAIVAVLLVSPDFIASDFIAEHELPGLLNAAHNEGLSILWIPIRSSMYKETELDKYQAAINPEKPLAQMKRPEQEKTLVGIAELIHKMFNSADKEQTSLSTRDIRGSKGQTKVSSRRVSEHTGPENYLVPAFAAGLTVDSNELELINIGNTTGINIEIDPVNLQFESAPDANIAFEKSSYIRAGESRAIKAASRFGDEPTDQGWALNWLFHLKEEYSTGRVFPLRITFQDILGKSYVQVVEMGSVHCGCRPGRVEVLDD